MIIDYRRLNKITKKINYPIPNFDDLLEKLSGATVFITLDLANGYLQVPLAENAKEKRAFITETQTSEFTRAMLGLVNAPKVFAKLMHKVLGTAQKQGIAFTFFDDTCIFVKSWGELVVNLIQVLDMLKKAGLTLNLKKCRVGMKKVEYLGYVLGQPGERKGLASFFRRFVPNFAQVAMPITDQLKAKKIFEWMSDQETAFNLIKKNLVERPTLRFYNPNAQRTELHTDT